MKKNMKIVWCLGICFTVIKGQSAITYSVDAGGRLGDKLIMYVKAKWVAYTFNLPFFYKPFPYSNQLEMHVKEQHFNEKIKKLYEKEVEYRDLAGAIDKYIYPHANILYVIHYWFNLPHWEKKYHSVEIMDWPEIVNDKRFIQELKKTIALRDTTGIHYPSQEKITVAVHVRRGSGGDWPLLSRQRYSDQMHPLKFPPIQYYVDQIKRLSQMYNNAEMYVYIYTDAKDHISIMQLIQKSVDMGNITFNCREKNIDYQNNVLQDMFSMANYDCLIRSGSNYAQIAQLIGNHKVVIYPKSYKWVGDRLVMDDIGIFLRED